MLTEYRPEEAYYMMSCVGSSEMHALSLGIMHAGADYSVDQIATELTEIQGSNPAWEVPDSSGKNYLTTLANAGFVESERDRYRLSHSGYFIGKAVAGHVLQLSSEVGPAQSQFTGRNMGIRSSDHTEDRTGNIHPIQNRLAIMRRLIEAKGEPVSGADCQRAMGVVGTYELLRVLAKADLLSMSATGKKPTVAHVRGPSFDELQSYNVSAPMTQAVVKVLQQTLGQNPDQSLTNSVITELVQQSKDPYIRNLSASEIRHRVSTSVSHLRARNILSRLEASRHEVGGCIAWLNETQTLLAARLLSIFDGLLNPTSAYLYEGHAALHRLLAPANQSAVRALVRKAIDSSSLMQNAANKKSTTRAHILAALDKVERASVAEVHAAVAAEAKDGETIHVSAVRAALLALAQEGEIKVEKAPGRTAKQYFLRQRPQKQTEEAVAQTLSPALQTEQPPRDAAAINKHDLAQFWGKGAPHDRLRGYIGKRVSDLDATDEITMDVLATILGPRTNTPIMDEKGNIGWVYGVANNRIAEYYRKQGRQQRYDNIAYAQQKNGAIPPRSADSEVIEKMERFEIQRLVATAIQEARESGRLSDHLQQILEVEIMNPDIPAKDGGECIGISEVAYRVGRFRLRQCLRPFLSRHLRSAVAQGAVINNNYLEILSEI